MSAINLVRWFRDPDLSDIDEPTEMQSGITPDAIYVFNVVGDVDEEYRLYTTERYGIMVTPDNPKGEEAYDSRSSKPEFEEFFQITYNPGMEPTPFGPKEIADYTRVMGQPPSLLNSGGPALQPPGESRMKYKFNGKDGWLDLDGWLYSQREGGERIAQVGPGTTPEQPEEMGMHNPFESRLDAAIEEGIGSAIGKGLGKVAGWGAGQIAAGAKSFAKGAGEAYKGATAEPKAAPAAPAAAKPGMAKPAAAKPVVVAKPAAKKAYEQEVYNKAISSSDEGEFLGNLRYFYNWAKSPQGKDRVVPRQLEKMMAYAVFKYLTNPSFTMSSAKDIMKNVSIPISGADFDGKPEPAGKPEAAAEKTPTPVSVKAPEKAEEPAKKEEPKAEKPEAKKEPAEKEEAKKESKDKSWDGWLSEVVADWV